MPPFFAFRIMVGIGLLMIAAGAERARGCGGAAGCSRRAGISAARAACLVVGFVAVIAGWMVTESGRQPWVAYGILRTADAASPVPADTVATTLVLFVVVYGIVFAMGIYYINRLIARGPQGRRSTPGRRHCRRRRSIGRCDARGLRRGRTRVRFDASIPCEEAVHGMVLCR